ncbi:hypothetical protein [Roseimaritima sediminicola]|uniref:hypothetical protein n=1 Tax=Roseimaritima sediminicola TaxID=2662066 RepID=UPI0012982CF0|nr:hypothetical protein [Roseimaritima sediminicola]
MKPMQFKSARHAAMIVTASARCSLMHSVATMGPVIVSSVEEMLDDPTAKPICSFVAAPLSVAPPGLCLVCAPGPAVDRPVELNL